MYDYYWIEVLLAVVFVGYLAITNKKGNSTN